jgi:hypothetical protein
MEWIQIGLQTRGLMMTDEKNVDVQEDSEDNKVQRTIDAVLAIYDALKEKDLLDVVAPACANIMAAMHDHHLGGEEHEDSLLLSYVATVKGDKFYTITIDPDIESFLTLCMQSGMTDIGLGDAVTFQRDLEEEGEGGEIKVTPPESKQLH